MDLYTMGSKLEQGMYKNRFEFQADFRLIVANAKQYNMPGSFVHNEAISLEIFFEKRRGFFFISMLPNVNEFPQNGRSSARRWISMRSTMLKKLSLHPDLR